MPNNVRNRLVAPPDILARIIGVDSDGESAVDFNRIIPTPPEIVQDSISMHVKTAAEIALGLVDLFQPPRGGSDLRAATEMLRQANAIDQLKRGPHPKDFSDKDFNAFIRMMQAHRACGGLMDWHDWNTAKWGTKWNAYSFTRVSDTDIRFDTAWSAPHLVIQKLASLTDEAILHEWADEDTGSNVGYRHYLAGEWVEHHLDRSRAGYELRFKLAPGDAEDYRLVDGKYVFVDEGEDEPAPSAARESQ